MSLFPIVPAHLHYYHKYDKNAVLGHAADEPRGPSPGKVLQEHLDERRPLGLQRARRRGNFTATTLS